MLKNKLMKLILCSLLVLAASACFGQNSCQGNASLTMCTNYTASFAITPASNTANCGFGFGSTPYICFHKANNSAMIVKVASGGGFTAGLDGNSQTEFYDPSTNTWAPQAQLSPAMCDIAVINKYFLWGVDCSHNIYKLTPNSANWQPINNGAALRVSATSDGTTFVIGTDNCGYYWNGGGWTYAGLCSLADIGALPGNQAVAVSGGQVYRLNGSWSAISYMTGITGVAADDNDRIYVIKPVTKNYYGQNINVGVVFKDTGSGLVQLNTPIFESVAWLTAGDPINVWATSQHVQCNHYYNRYICNISNTYTMWRYSTASLTGTSAIAGSTTCYPSPCPGSPNHTGYANAYWKVGSMTGGQTNSQAKPAEQYLSTSAVDKTWDVFSCVFDTLCFDESRGPDTQVLCPIVGAIFTELFNCFLNKPPINPWGWGEGVTVGVYIDGNIYPPGSLAYSSICAGIQSWTGGGNNYNCSSIYQPPPTWPGGDSGFNHYIYVTQSPDSAGSGSETCPCGWFPGSKATNSCGIDLSGWNPARCPKSGSNLLHPVMFIDKGATTPQQFQGSAAHEAGHTNFLGDCDSCQTGKSVMGPQKTLDPSQPLNASGCDILWSSIFEDIEDIF